MNARLNKSPCVFRARRRLLGTYRRTTWRVSGKFVVGTDPLLILYKRRGRRCDGRSPGWLGDFSWGPDKDVLPAREMQERVPSERDAQGFGHRVARKFSLGWLQRPGRMMNLAANDLALSGGRIKAIAFGQEMLERSSPRGNNAAYGTIPAF
jgi:hypothetical protein